MGSGGNYLSNEVFYRIAYMRVKANSNILTGHIHMNFMQPDKHNDRVIMVNAGRNLINKLLE